MPISVQVFEPAMCCSTGICGPSVDPQLARFAADLEWLGSQGVTVERFNLAQQPQAFVTNPLAKQALESENALPLVVVDGIVKSQGAYPTRGQLAEWVGVADMVTKGPSSGCCGSNASDVAPKKSKCCC